jgi:hypothetical protein
LADIRDWSTTAASNTDLFPEGMAPGSVNDSGRTVQAEIKQLEADYSGTLTTGGTSTAYTLTLNTAPAALADGLAFSFTANATCGASPTLAVTPSGGSVFTAKSLRKFVRGVEQALEAGDLIANGHYDVQYDSAANSAAGGYIVLNPAAPIGSIIKSAVQRYTTYSGGVATVIPADDTIPQITEGSEIFNVSFTPSSTTSKLRLRLTGSGSVMTGLPGTLVVALFNGATDAIATVGTTVPTANYLHSFALEHEYTPGSTSAITFSVRFGPGAAGTAAINGNAARLFGGSSATTLVIEEIRA